MIIRVNHHISSLIRLGDKINRLLNISVDAEDKQQLSQQLAITSMQIECAMAAIKSPL